MILKQFVQEPSNRLLVRFYVKTSYRKVNDEILIVKLVAFNNYFFVFLILF